MGEEKLSLLENIYLKRQIDNLEKLIQALDQRIKKLEDKENG